MNKKHLERIGEKKAFLEIIDIYHRQERGVNVLYANCKCECGKEKARKRMNKKVRQIDMKTNEVIKEFESISKAKEETGITTISHYLNGRSNHSGGFYWEYCN